MTTPSQPPASNAPVRASTVAGDDPGPARGLPAIDGIGIDYAHRLHYLETLAVVIQNQFAGHPTWAPIVEKIAGEIGYEPKPLRQAEMAAVDFEHLPSVMGWFHFERLEQLIERDWLAAETNEFDSHQTLLDRLPYLQQARRLSVLGAGVGRMVDWLAAREHVEYIDVSDLSFLCLQIAKTMISGDRSTLHDRVSRARRLIEIDGEGRLQSRDVEPSYRASLAKACHLDYRVADAGDMQLPETCEVVLAPYLIDAPDIWASMLTRLCDAMHSGQRLVLLTQICPRRDPEEIVAALGHLNFRVDRVQLENLPYSLARHDLYYTRTLVDTLVIEAEKQGETDRTCIGLKPRIDADTLQAFVQKDLVPRQRHKPFSLSKRQRGAVKRALFAPNYDEFHSVLREGLGRLDAAMVAGFLCSRQMVALLPGQAARRFG